MGNTPLMELVSMRKPEDESEEILKYLISKRSDLKHANCANQAALDLTTDNRLKMLVEKALGYSTNSALDKMFAEEADSEADE